MTTINSTTLRNNLADSLNFIADSKDFMLITSKGEIRSALVNIDLFEDLLAGSNKEYLQSVQEAREQINKGDVFTHSEVFGEL